MNQDQQTNSDQTFNENQIEEHHSILVKTMPNVLNSQNPHISTSVGRNSSFFQFLNIITGTYLMMGISLILFCLFLVLKIDGDLSWKFSIVALPFYVFLLNCGICLYKIISHPILDYKDLGKHLTLFTIISNIILLGVFSLLLMLKLDGFLDCDYTFVFLSLYVGLAITLFYVCFIFPGLIDKELNLYNEAFLVLLYYFGIMVWLIMLNLRLDNFIHWFNYKVFLVLFIVLGTHILLNIKVIFESENLIKSSQNFIFVLLLSFCLVIVVMKLDNNIEKSWTLVCAPIFSVILLVYGLQFTTIFEKFVVGKTLDNGYNK